MNRDSLLPVEGGSLDQIVTSIARSKKFQSEHQTRAPSLTKNPIGGPISHRRP